MRYDMFKEGSLFSRSAIRENLKKFNIIPYVCKICKNDGKWQGKFISLELDHINGVRNDNRLENLRFLCPNCHSQQKTSNTKKVLQNKTLESLEKEIVSLSKIYTCRQILLKLGFSDASANYKKIQEILAKNNCSLIEGKMSLEAKKNRMHQNLCSKEDLEKLVWEGPVSYIAKKFGVSRLSVIRWIKFYNINNKPTKGYWKSGQRNGSFCVTEKFKSITSLNV